MELGEGHYQRLVGGALQCMGQPLVRQTKHKAQKVSGAEAEKPCPKLPGTTCFPLPEN